jgi:SpoIID/LytB domain protein
LQERYADLDAFFASTACAALADDEARLWRARAQLDRSHFEDALKTLQSLSQTSRPLALALAAEASQGLKPGWPGAWPQALSGVAGTRWEAATALAAAEAAEAAGVREEAEALYKETEKADPSYSLVHERLARLYEQERRFREERVRMERALRVDPDNSALRGKLNALLKAQPEQKAALIKEQAAGLDRFLARENPAVFPRLPGPGEPVVRVGLLLEAPRFRLKLGGAYAVEGEGRTLPAKSTWELHLGRHGGWELRSLGPDPKEAPLLFSQVLRLRPVDPAATFGLYDVDHGAGYFWAEKEDRYYRGLAELRPQEARGVTLVNELGLEAYLCSVLPSEMPPYWPKEALEAQAIAARTEAWRSLGRFAAKGYDLCPTVACAVYSGVGVEEGRSSAAVSGTAGLVLEDSQGHLYPTYYMHHSGGHTQEAWEAWSGEAKPGAASMAVVDAPADSKLAALFPLTPAGLLHYLDDLDGDVDAWARDSFSFRWTLRFSAGELDQWAGRRHKVAPFKAVLPLQRTAGGYVQQAAFVGEGGLSVGGSDHLRSALKGMKSNLFYVELRQDPDGHLKSLLLHGGGWGHGVGLAQAGAKAQAQAGLSAVQILHHYFPRARFKRRYPGPQA